MVTSTSNLPSSAHTYNGFIFSDDGPRTGFCVQEGNKLYISGSPLTIIGQGQPYISDFMQTKTIEDLLKEMAAAGKVQRGTLAPPTKPRNKPGVMLSDERGITKAQNAPGRVKPAPATVAPSTRAKPALSGFETLAGHDHRPGLWGAPCYD